MTENEVIDDLKSTIRHKSNEIDDLERKVSDLEDKISDLERELRRSEDEARRNGEEAYDLRRQLRNSERNY